MKFTMRVPGAPGGIAAQQAFMASAARILSLSGTAFRSRDPIVFIETRSGRSVANDTYSYGEALADGVCRPLKFAAIGGTATLQAPGGSIETVSFDDDLNEQGESYRLRAARAWTSAASAFSCMPPTS